MAESKLEAAPNFIVIGPGKSGTSWLYTVLNAHPQVCMSSAKETLYFEDYYGRGPQWYSRFFRAADPQIHRAVGEISNTYIFSPLAAERIAKDFPTMKLIATLRHPAERAFSHYLFLKRNGELTCSFEEALKRRPDLRTRGNYFEHLQAYRQHFPESQLLVMIYDDLKRDVESYAQRLFDFIGIDRLEDSEVLHSRVLEASEPRSRWLARCTVAAAQVVRKAGFPDIVTKVKGGLLPKLVFRKMSRRAEIEPAIYEQLCDYYREDITKLSAWLSRDLVAAWLTSKTNDPCLNKASLSP